LAAPKQSSLSTELTRDLILEAAEHVFAHRGFSAARLEDIAEQVGITRAAVIYHFGDKQKLYSATLESAFNSLATRIREGRAKAVGQVARIEAVIDAWIEYSWQRPNLARLFMREVADAGDGFSPQIGDLVSPLFSAILEDLEAGRSTGAFRDIDPRHVVTILAGATTWQATSAHLLEEPLNGNLSANEDFDNYRMHLLGVVRFLLGIPNQETAK
jgi:TetR/AcrR family transcriptional regulator